MDALLSGHGWGAISMILAIVGWSGLMLFFVYLVTRPRQQNPWGAGWRGRGRVRSHGQKRGGDVYRSPPR